MTGDFIHEAVILDGLEQIFQDFAVTHRNYHVANGFIDLLIDQGTNRTAIEAELTPKRVANDVAKAIQAQAYELWIVTPTASLMRRVKALKLLRTTPNISTFVLTVGTAKARALNCFSLFSTPMRKPEEKQKGMSADQIQRAISFAQDHTFQAVPTSDGHGISVEIPWWNSTTNEGGTDWHPVYSWRELRAVLGY